MKAAIIICISLSTLQGCFNSSSSNNSGGGTMVENQLKTLSSPQADSEPGPIADATSLQNDISSLFSDADSEPVDIEDGDSLDDVFNRTGN